MLHGLRFSKQVCIRQHAEAGFSRLITSAKHVGHTWSSPRAHQGHVTNTHNVVRTQNVVHAWNQNVAGTMSPHVTITRHVSHGPHTTHHSWLNNICTKYRHVGERVDGGWEGRDLLLILFHSLSLLQLCPFSCHLCLQFCQLFSKPPITTGLGLEARTVFGLRRRG